MTDKDKLVSLLKEWEVPFIEDEEYGDNTVILEADSQYQDGPGRGKVLGYGGFVTHFTFDETGTFVRVGIWE